jgi:signal peptidase I
MTMHVRQRVAALLLRRLVAEMDLPTIFILLLSIAGAIWLVDAVLLKPRRMRLAQTQGARSTDPLVVQYARSFFPVILIVVLIRSFVIEPFRIPSASMMPGLIDGDFIFVSKFSYGLRLPVINTKILNTGRPQRGDVIVFRLPADPSVNFIKRLIGLPGDHVLVRDNQIFINGARIAQQPDGHYLGGDEFAGSDLALESFGNKAHVVMFARDRPSKDFEAVVPQGEYFFMGDNRNDSEDGRFSAVGFVPDKNLVGHAVRVALSWPLPGWPVWNRFGIKIN